MACVALAMVSCGAKSATQEEAAEVDSAEVAVSEVYFIKDITPENLLKIYEALNREAEGRVAVKLSTGEPGGHNFLNPDLIKDLVQMVNGTIVECNTAYAGKRMNTADHLQAAKDHGFTAIAEVDIMDAEGEMQIPVTGGKHLQYDIVGNHLTNYDFMVVLSHFKGHAMGGFGGVLKNASIGVASTAGKAYIHSAGKTDNATKAWLPGNLASGKTQDDFLESMAAAAQGVADVFGKNIIYISVMNNMSVDCDCVSHPDEPLLQDRGIMASLDPVAVDKACLDLVFNITPSEGDDNGPLLERIKSRHGTHIVEWGEHIGLGSSNYVIVDLDQR